MGYASKEALLEYTQQSKGTTGFGKGMGFFILIVGLASLATPLGIVFSLFFIASGILWIYTASQNNSEYKKYLKIAESTGELQRVLNDFANSQSLADDRIRLGSEYIFGKHQGRPISYAELRKVYPYVVGGTSCSRYLRGVTAGGQDYILCEFIVRHSQKDPHPDESYIYQVIVTKNPNVHLGYK